MEKNNLLVVLVILLIAFMVLNQNNTLHGAAVTDFDFNTFYLMKGIESGRELGQHMSTITDSRLKTLAPFYIRTQEGASKGIPVLTLSDDFNGPMIDSTQDYFGRFDTYLIFDEQEPAFSYDIAFSSEIVAKLEDGRAKGLEDEIMYILGKPFAITRAEASGNEIELTLIGPMGSSTGVQIELKDTNVNDDLFTTNGARVNGKDVQSKVRIKGSVGKYMRIRSLEYRPIPTHRITGDIHVPVLRGLRQYLKEPQGLLNPSFDIIFAKYSGGVKSYRVDMGSSTGSGDISFIPRGDRYDLSFTNNNGVKYLVPYAELSGGTVYLGKDSKRLRVKEGSSSSDFNINVNDMVVVTSENDIDGRTGIFELEQITGNNIHIRTRNSRSEFAFDSSGHGTLIVEGVSYDFYANPSTSKIVVDQDNDGKIEGDTTVIVAGGGVIIEPGTTTTFRIKDKLRKHSDYSGDETTSIKFVENSGDIDIYIGSQSSLKMERDNDGLRKGMTTFGLHFIQDDRRDSSSLDIDLPGGASTGRVSVTTSGQATGYVLITTEREQFIRKI